MTNNGFAHFNHKPSFKEWMVMHYGYSINDGILEECAEFVGNDSILDFIKEGYTREESIRILMDNVYDMYGDYIYEHFN